MLYEVITEYCRPIRVNGLVQQQQGYQNQSRSAENHQITRLGVQLFKLPEGGHQQNDDRDPGNGRNDGKLGSDEFTHATKNIEQPSAFPFKMVLGVGDCDPLVLGVRITSYNVCYTKLLRCSLPLSA